MPNIRKHFLNDTVNSTAILKSKYFPLNLPKTQLWVHLLHFPNCSSPRCRKTASWLPHTRIRLPSPFKRGLFHVSLSLLLFHCYPLRVGRQMICLFIHRFPGDVDTRSGVDPESLAIISDAMIGWDFWDAFGRRLSVFYGQPGRKWIFMIQWADWMTVSKSSHTLSSDFIVPPSRVGAVHFSTNTECGCVTCPWVLSGHDICHIWAVVLRALT